MKSITLVLFLLSSYVLSSQNLLGNKFVDYSGTHSLDDDGNTIAVSNLFPQNTEVIEVYDFVNDQWQQRTGNPEFDRGNPVLSGDGNTLIIGKPSLGIPEIVSVFQWDGNTWTKKGSDFVLNSANTLFGNFVFINHDGNRIFFSDEQGDLLTYQFDGTNWNLINTLGLNTLRSVDINSSGDRISYYVNNNSNGSIANYDVKIFELQNNAWQQIGNNINTPLQVFNSSIFLKTKLNSAGDKIVISAPTSFEFNTNAGAFAVYRLVNNQWVQSGNIVTGDEPFVFLGSDVAINEIGNKVLVGIVSSNVNGQGSGNNKLYQLNNLSDQWEEILEINGELAGIQSGGDVDMNASGDIISIGTNTSTILNQVRVFGIGNLSTESTFLNNTKIFPNPNNGRFSITLNEPAAAEIYNLEGKLIFKDYSLNPGQNYFNLENLSKGIHLLKLTSEKNSKTFKLLIE
jgi:hypothetical protein